VTPILGKPSTKGKQIPFGLNVGFKRGFKKEENALNFKEKIRHFGAYY